LISFVVHACEGSSELVVGPGLCLCVDFTVLTC
jgi:hypothetical protein